MQFIQRLAFVLAVLCSSCLSLAATYYVNASASGTAGNDSANGTTTTTPWLTLGKLNDNIATGDTVYLSGDFYATGEGISINSLSNVTIAQWAGMPQA